MADEQNAAKRNMIDENIKFEDIIEELGGNGKFQMRMNIIFNTFAVLFATMASFGKIIALTVPDHWCHVPGREDNNFTVEMWKNLTIPRQNEEYSKCLMKVAGKENVTTSCTHGWEYNTTWLSLTVPSQENWVCDKELYPYNVYFVSHIVATTFGILLFYVGDRYGRRIQFLLGMSATAVSLTLLPVSASVVPLYTALSTFSEGAHLPMAEATMATGIELASIEHRSTVNCLVYVSYCLGLIFIGLLAWFLKNWIHFILVASIPCFIPLLLHRYLPESPRWLINKGRKEESFKVLERIAHTNGKTLSPGIKKKVQFIYRERASGMDIRIMLTNKTLIKNTIILALCRSVSGVVLFTLLFSNNSFGENPFVAYIGQGVLQLVATYVAHITGNNFGRRITHCLILLTTAVLNVAIAFLFAASSEQWMITTLSLALMFCGDASFILTNLQSLELHPTSLRQIAIAVEYVFAQCIMSIPPYLAHLGKTAGFDIVYGMLAAVTLIMAVLMSFVPETFNEKLPETNEDISHFGEKQKYWSLPRRK